MSVSMTGACRTKPMRLQFSNLPSPFFNMSYLS